jgi:hypothetical protein
MMISLFRANSTKPLENLAGAVSDAASAWCQSEPRRLLGPKRIRDDRGGSLGIQKRSGRARMHMQSPLRGPSCCTIRSATTWERRTGLCSSPCGANIGQDPTASLSRYLTTATQTAIGPIAISHWHKELDRTQGTSETQPVDQTTPQSSAGLWQDQLTRDDLEARIDQPIRPPWRPSVPRGDRNPVGQTSSRRESRSVLRRRLVTPSRGLLCP